MTISYLGLTDTDQIRAVIGADTKDLSDADIDYCGFKDELKVDLMEWLPTYETIISEGATGTPTTDQTRKYLRLKNYAKYFMSWLVGSASQHSLMQKTSDGSNELQRFTTGKLTELLDRIADLRDGNKSFLEKLVDTSDTNTYSHFGVVTPTYDPVTNE